MGDADRPGKIIDTDRFFVICSNVVGACLGTTGPASTNPATGKPWALAFPVVTIRDMVRAQAMLIDRLGIDSLFAVIGGSMGGMQVLEWASTFKERVFAAMPIATAHKHSAQNIAFHEVGRQAVMADPAWAGGRYRELGQRPEKGLAVARMAAHITYLSEPALQRKFGRKLQDRDAPTFSFDADFQVESYLRHQGSSFVERFDANSYLYLTRAMDYFDLAADHGGVLAKAFEGTRTRSLPRVLHIGLAVSDLGQPRAGACAERRRRSGVLRRDRQRQGSRRFPSRGAGVLRHAARLRRRGGQGAGARVTISDPHLSSGPGARVDLLMIADMVEPGSRVLDVGCGDGALLKLLAEGRNVDARGIELSRDGVAAAWRTASP